MPLKWRDVDQLRNQKPWHVNLHSTTVGYAEGSITSVERGLLLSDLAQSECSLWRGQRQCVAVSYGKKSRRTFEDISEEGAGEVLWFGDDLPLIVRLVSWAIPNRYGGLVRIAEKPGRMARVLGELSTLAMVELFSVSDWKKESQVLGRIRGRRHISSDEDRVITRSLCSDPSYFSVGLDGDNQESETGLVGWMSHGSDCPTELIQLFESWATPPTSPR